MTSDIPPGRRRPGSFDAAERRVLATALAGEAPVFCPVCRAPISISEVRPPEGVSYVRRRVVVLCTGCRRTAALDVSGRRVT